MPRTRSLLFSVVVFAICNVLSAAEARHETLGLKTAQQDANFVLIADGKPRATIVIARQATDRERFVAEDLQRILEAISGAKIPVQDESEPAEGNRIQIGRTERNLQQCKLDNLKPEGFRIRISGNDLCLCGRDDAGMEFAVYTFLERYCDVGWFWPGELGEVIPHRQTLAFGRIDDLEEPDYLLRKIEVNRRGHQPAGNFHQADPPALPETLLWRKRNRLGGSVDYVGGAHSFGRMVPPAKYGPTHPEYFALVKGKRTWKNFNGKHGCQLCTTNPDVVELGIEWARKFLDEHPEITCVTIAPNDGGGFCECPRCRALDKAAGSPQGVISDRMITFANQVAAGVEKTHPDRAVLMLAYSRYKQPPLKVKPRKNVWVQLCICCDRFWSEKKKRQEYDKLNDWARIAENLAIYEYYVWRGSADLPRSFLPLIEETIPRFHAQRSRLFYTQSFDNFGPYATTYYVASRLLWNVQSDADQELDAFCRKCFGKAASPMRAWFQLVDDRWRYAVETVGYRLYGGSPAYWLAMFPPDVLAKARTYLEEARNLADPEALGRVEFFEKELRYTERTLEALRLLKELENAGIVDLQDDYPTRFKDTGSYVEIDIASEESKETSAPNAKAGAKPKITPREVRDLITRTIQAWETRNAYIEELRGQHIIDYWHVKEDADRDYGHDPTEKLKKLLAKFQNEK